MTPEPLIICPTYQAFSPEVQRRMADDLETLPATSPLWLMASDWMSLRDQIRAGCE